MRGSAPEFYAILPVTAGLLILAVIALSAYQFYIINFGPDAPAYSMFTTDETNLPLGDARGAFLQLDPNANQRFPTNLLGLLETETPGVVTTEQAVHLLPSELSAVVVRQSAIADSSDYRVYRLGAEAYPMTVERLANQVMVRVHPESGPWLPGDYIVDIPANGTFGGREYYAFVVDAAP